MLAPAYCENNGRPSVPVRMMAGLTFLKFMFGMSDQDVLDGWVENPYWQAFCGGEFFEHEPPTDQTTMSRWRSRAGETGVEAMIREVLASAVRNKVAKKADFTKVNVDTTVQEKNIRFPTDARTLDQARERVVATGEKLGIRFARNYKRKGKTMLRKHSGHVKAKQFNRAENVVRAMKQYLRNVVNFAEAQQIVPKSLREVALIEQLREYIERSRKLLAQDRNTPGKDKIYSFHEPQVECIAKGKAIFLGPVPKIPRDARAFSTPTEKTYSHPCAVHSPHLRTKLVPPARQACPSCAPSQSLLHTKPTPPARQA